MRAAKATAAERGESLKDFFMRAITDQLGRASATTSGGRAKLPLVRSHRPGSVELSNADIDDALTAEDADRYTDR